MSIKAIVTGATGMVGEGVLHECLKHEDVEEVLVINRKPCGVTHAKLKEIVHGDFFDLKPIESQLKGYNACFYCLGVSSVGMKEKEYNRLTYELTLNFARTLAEYDSEMVFCYISGAGTDSSERGKIMWARVKGRTENHLQSLHFKRAYMFRPGYIQPTKGLRNTLKMYSYFSWLYPVMVLLIPKYVCTLSELGRAMINCVKKMPNRSVVDVRKILMLSKQ